MQPPLTCPPITSTPPPWTAALLPLDWRLVVFPLLVIPICVGAIALMLRGMPAATRRRMAPWLATGGPVLFAGACCAIFDYLVVEGRWSDMLLAWANRVASSPGFLACQYTALDHTYTTTLSNSTLIVAVYFGLLLLGTALTSQAGSIRRAYLTTARPGIPPVDDVVAARRAIVHRPYRRGRLSRGRRNRARLVR